ncbi:MAG TPA: DMT family transporter [Stenomitos sp.]
MTDLSSATSPQKALPTDQARKERRGYGFMVGSSLSFAVMGALVKVASETLPFQEVTFFRAFGGLVFIGAWMLIRRLSFQANDKGLLIWRGVMGWAALTAYFYAIAHMYLADAVLLNYTSSFFTALLAAVFLGERLTTRTVLCLATALGGVALVVGPKGGFWNLGALAGLGSALCAAFAYVAVKRATANNSPWAIVLYFSLVASVLTLPWLLRDYHAPSPNEWLLLVGLAASATVAQLLMTYGYQLARASTASVVTLSTPLFSAALAYACFQLVPTWGTWLGGALILGAGVVLATRP